MRRNETTKKFINDNVILCNTMEALSIRFEKGFLNEIEKAMKINGYSTKTEFIREAVRDKIKNLKKEIALMRLERLYGAGAKQGRKITDEDIHRAGEEAFSELEEKFGFR